MAGNNFTSVYGFGEEIAFKQNGASYEGRIISVTFYPDEVYYRVMVNVGKAGESAWMVNARDVSLVQKPLRERLISKLSKMTDEEAEVTFSMFNGKENPDGKSQEV